MSAFLHEAALPTAAIALILTAAHWASRHPKNTPPVAASTQPTTRGATTQPACHSTGPRGGHYYRGQGNWWICSSCGDRAWRESPAVFDQELTDRQIREVMDDARRITREAAGGAA